MKETRTFKLTPGEELLILLRDQIFVVRSANGMADSRELELIEVKLPPRTKTVQSSRRVDEY